MFTTVVVCHAEGILIFHNILIMCIPGGAAFKRAAPLFFLTSTMRHQKTTYLKFMSHYEVVRTDLKSPSNFEGVPEGRGSLYKILVSKCFNYKIS